VKPAFERTPRQQWESFHCEVVRGSSYHATWHFHPECQITLVLKSHGYRLVGDNITTLRPGDLVLVGANLPHVWYQDDSTTASPDAVHAIVVRFTETFLGPAFLEVPEMHLVLRLLKRAKRGLVITGSTREQVSAKMQRLPATSGLERLAGLLSILATLAESTELKPIASPGFAPALGGGDQERVERVIGFIDRHLDEEIDREVLAREAHLSPGAFSRFFKLRTGKTPRRYLNEVRVGRACRLLSEVDLKVTDIALRSGFQNLANFNRRFRQIMRMTPQTYRRQMRQGFPGALTISSKSSGSEYPAVGSAPE
jgi:AraC-like DNA-binding protein